MARGSRDLSWIHLALLFTVSLMPFSTARMAEFVELRLALLLYWFNVLLSGAVLYASWSYATHAGLLTERGALMQVGVKRRIIIAQMLYAFGAALCVLSTYASIGFIVLVQLNYAIAPRIGLLSRL